MMMMMMRTTLSWSFVSRWGGGMFPSDRNACGGTPIRSAPSVDQSWFVLGSTLGLPVVGDPPTTGLNGDSSAGMYSSPSSL
jgi:hypothetical protein